MEQIDKNTGLDKYIGKSIRIFFDDNSPKPGIKEGTLISYDDNFIVIERNSKSEAIPTARIIRIELSGGHGE